VQEANNDESEKGEDWGGKGNGIDVPVANCDFNYRLLAQLCVTVSRSGVSYHFDDVSVLLVMLY